MKYISLLVIAFFCFPLSLFADTGYVMVECPKDVKKGEEIECKISAYSIYEISAIEYGFILPDGVTKVKTTVDDIWEGTEEDDLFLLYTDENKVGTFDVGTIFLRTSTDMDKIVVGTNRLIFTDSSFQERIIVDDTNVNQTENDKEIKNHKKNNFIKYGIILLIIGVFIVIVIIKIRRSGNRER